MICYGVEAGLEMICERSYIVFVLFSVKKCLLIYSSFSLIQVSRSLKLTCFIIIRRLTSSSSSSFIYMLNSFTSVWCSCTTFSTFLHIFFLINKYSLFLSSIVPLTEISFSVGSSLLPGYTYMQSSHLKVFSPDYRMFSDIAKYPMGLLCLGQIISIVFYNSCFSCLNFLFLFAI